MSEFKNASNDEKITHLLAGELSNEEKAELEKNISTDSGLKNEFKSTKLLISLLEADKKAMPIEEGIGAERKNNIFGNRKENKKVISIKQFKFTLVAAAIVLFSTIFLSFDWNSKVVVTPEKPSEVLGVSSFNMAMPSGTYFFTLKDGVLKLDKIEPLNGVDFFTESGVKAGDELLMLNGIDTKAFKKEEWRDLLTSMIDKPSVLKIKRNGQILPSK
jgi:hypothetical protein